MNRRRMMMSGQNWAKEPLVIYKSGEKALSNGSVVLGNYYEIGGENKGLYCSCAAGSGLIGRDGWFIISLEGTDISKYGKLVAEYKTGLSEGYTYGGCVENKFGFGYSASRDLDFAEYQSPEADSKGGTFVFDISKIEDPIYLICEVNETTSNYDYDIYGFGYMLFSDIHLE